MKKIKCIGVLTAVGLFAAAMLWSGQKPKNCPALSRKDGGESKQYGQKLAALTFDDGPKAGTTDVLLKGLKARDIHATFFLIGEQIEDNKEIVERMYEDGHQIGNHTFEHVNLAEASCDGQKCQLFLCSEALSGVIGQKPDFIRPPFGSISESLKAWIDVPVILWSVDTMDWTGKGRSEIADYVVSNIAPGDIVLMHDIYEESVAAALMAADVLKSEGYRLVTVSELFEAYGIGLEAGKAYRRAVPK